MSVLTDTRPTPSARPRVQAQIHVRPLSRPSPRLSPLPSADVRPRTRSWRLRLRLRLGWALCAAGLGMIPWLFVLAVELPARATAEHWIVVWVGLDSLEALGLMGTGLLLRRRDARASLSSAATAMLLLMDAWFDVLTSAPGADRLLAVAMALGAELPLSVLCAVLAVRLFPQARPCP